MQTMMSDEDDELWDKMMEDVTPLSGRTHRSPKKLTKTSSKKSIQPIKKTELPKQRGKELDRRTARNLAQGKIPIDGRLDLHGMSQSQAHSVLTPFILNAYERQKRCILVVTGKGQGILQRQVPLWLEQAPLTQIVLRVVPAHPKDGGAGALYIYLRKQRR